MKMAFEHVCLTNEEATRELADALARRPSPWLMLGMRRSSFFFSVAVAGFVLAGVILISAIHGVQFNAGGLAFSGLMVLSVLLLLVSSTCHSIEKGAAEREDVIQSELEPASIRDLKFLRRIAKRDRDLAQVIGGWIRTGRTIRVRDVRAVWAYTACEELRQEKRDKLLCEIRVLANPKLCLWFEDMTTKADRFPVLSAARGMDEAAFDRWLATFSVFDGRDQRTLKAEAVERRYVEPGLLEAVLLDTEAQPDEVFRSLAAVCTESGVGLWVRSYSERHYREVWDNGVPFHSKSSPATDGRKPGEPEDGV